MTRGICERSVGEMHSPVFDGRETTKRSGSGTASDIPPRALLGEGGRVLLGVQCLAPSVDIVYGNAKRVLSHDQDLPGMSTDWTQLHDITSNLQ